ncbi:dihydrofolate reductase family protein [Zobellia nedashkovskayae]
MFTSAEGGQFAGWLLDNGLIDQLKLKLNPIVLGKGVRLFGNSETSLVGKLIEKESMDSGLQFLTYDLK